MAEQGTKPAQGTPMMGVDPATGVTYFIAVDPASGRIGKAVTYTDKSGAITAGGTAQVLAAANTSRTGLLIQNQSTGDLWINSLATAIAGQPSIWLPAGSEFEFPATGVPTTAISIYGATTGQAFAAREW